MNIKFVLPAGDLASRKLAICERIKAEENFFLVQKIIVDLSNVLSISESYADEYFGVLVKNYGYSDVINKIQIINGDQAVIRSIAAVILRRKQEFNKNNYHKNEVCMRAY